MGRIAQPFVHHQSSGRVGKADFHGGHKKENRIQYFQKFHFYRIIPIFLDSIIFSFLQDHITFL